jgi:hypothetical protein
MNIIFAVISVLKSVQTIAQTLENLELSHGPPKKLAKENNYIYFCRQFQFSWVVDKLLCSYF